MPLLISYVFHGWGEGRYIYLICICFCSVTKSFPTLHNPMDCSMQGFPVPHHLPEFAQVPGHWIGDAIQPSHPLLPSSPSAFNLVHHQGLFQWVSSLHQVAKVLGASASASVLPMNIQDGFPLGLTAGSPYSPRDSQESFPTAHFKSINSSALSFLYGSILTSIHDYWKIHSFN